MKFRRARRFDPNAQFRRPGLAAREFQRPHHQDLHTSRSVFSEKALKLTLQGMP